MLKSTGHASESLNLMLGSRFDLLGVQGTGDGNNLIGELREALGQNSMRYVTYDRSNRAFVVGVESKYRDCPVWLPHIWGGKMDYVERLQLKTVAVFTKMRMLGIREGAKLIAPGLISALYNGFHVHIYIPFIPFEWMWFSTTTAEFMEICCGGHIDDMLSEVESYQEVMDMERLHDGKVFVSSVGLDEVPRYWVEAPMVAWAWRHWNDKGGMI